MEKIGKCYGCKFTLYLNPSGQWVTRDGATHCIRGSYRDSRGHRRKMPNSGPFTIVVSNKRNEK